MWRWTKRVFVVLAAFLLITALPGATYQWLATRKEPSPGFSSRTLQGNASNTSHSTAFVSNVFSTANTLFGVFADCFADRA